VVAAARVAGCNALYHEQVVGEFTREEVGERADVPAAYVDLLVTLGILEPPKSGVPQFSAGDVRRVRFVRSLEQGGLSLEGVGTAVRNGRMPLAFLDSPAWQRFGGLEQTTYQEASARTGIPLELLQAIREAMGFARPGPDDRLREDELDLVEWMKAALDAGANPASAERLLRIWGESARQMAHAGTDWFHAQFEVPLVNAGMSDGEVMDKASRAAAGVGALVDRVVGALYHAQSEHTWIANKVESVEATLEMLGLHRTTSRTSAMCFLT
jgi:DNA-binding transcriptional MerR regulator